jgi:hypothetical protein
VSPARHVGATVSLARIEGEIGEGKSPPREFGPTTLLRKPPYPLPPYPLRHPPSPVHALPHHSSGGVRGIPERSPRSSPSPGLDHSGILSSAQEFFHMTVYLPVYTWGTYVRIVGACLRYAVAPRQSTQMPTHADPNDTRTLPSLPISVNTNGTACQRWAILQRQEGCGHLRDGIGGSCP